jgi:MinD superfamily P-loop ATPase
VERAIHEFDERYRDDDIKMKKMTILSGKGGTGKTSITASLAALSTNAVFADCDVDASNLHLLLKPKVKKTFEFKGLKLAEINQDKCTQCGLCEENCRFNAIHNFTVNNIHCEGCKVCVHICPVQAIDFRERVCGFAYVSDTEFGPMSHAKLIPGMENAGKLVTLVRQNADKIAEDDGRELILVDGPPGIGCPVIASLTNIDHGLVVVEPTLSGIHDLKRALKLLDHFSVNPLVCINKYDINKENTLSIEKFCSGERIQLIGNIPFDPEVTKAMVNGYPVVKYSKTSPASEALKEMNERLSMILE